MKKALLAGEEGIYGNAEIMQTLNELGYDIDFVSSFSEAVERIRDGIDAVITGLYLETQMKTCFDATAKSGIFVAITARDSGVPHVALVTETPEVLSDTDKIILKGIKIIDLSRETRESLKKTLADFTGGLSGE